MRELALNHFLITIPTASDGTNPVLGSGSQKPLLKDSSSSLTHLTASQ